MDIINPFPGPWDNQDTIIIKPNTKVIHHHHYHEASSPRFKATRVGTKASHVVMILDDSCSMQSCKEGTISGFNEFVDGQRIDAAKTGLKTYISLVKFNGKEVSTVINRVDVKEVEQLTSRSYDPLGGSTNLLDGMGMTISRLNTSIKHFRKRDRDGLILAILTDGQENSSQKYNNEKIKMMIEECEDRNWGFMFLGANIDAFAMASNWGFGYSNTLQYNTSNMTESFAASTRVVNDMKAAYKSGMSTSETYTVSAFTDDERDGAGK